MYNIKELASSVFLVSYVPRIDLPHHIDVRYNGHSAPGFPQMVEIRDPSQSIIVHGNGLKSSIPGENATFIIETGGFASAKDFDIIVTEPNGSPLPVKCYQQKNGSLLVEWTPIRTGIALDFYYNLELLLKLLLNNFLGYHKIDVLHSDKPVMGSPFKCDAFDASKVKLEKIKLNNLVINKKVVFSRKIFELLLKLFIQNWFILEKLREKRPDMRNWMLRSPVLWEDICQLK